MLKTHQLARPVGHRGHRSLACFLRWTAMTALVAGSGSLALAQGPVGPAAPTRPVAPTAGTTVTPPSTAGGGSLSPKRTSKVDPRSLKVFAVVGGETIGRDKLIQECVRRYGNEVLDSLVNKQLILAACQEKGIVVTEADVHEEIHRMAAKFQLSADRWLEVIESERDMPPAKYMNDVVWPLLALRRIAASDVEVTPADLKNAWESEFGEKVRVRVIAASTKEKAEQIYAMAKANPAEFGNIAKDHSEDRTSASGRGWIPPIARHVGDPAVEKTVFALRDGEISPIIFAGNQFLFFHCEQHDPAIEVPPADQKRAEELLAERIRDEKLRVAAKQLMTDLKSRTAIQTYLPGAAQRGPAGVAATVGKTTITTEAMETECLLRHGQEILRGEINRQLLRTELTTAKLTVSDEDLKAEVARAAETYGYIDATGRPDTKAWLDFVTGESGSTAELYIEDAVWPSAALKKLVESQIAVTDEDLQKGFDANYGSRVEALAIVLSAERQAQKVWEMAKQNPTPEFFGELAYQYSIEPVSRANRGRVPPIQRYGGRPTLEEEAFRLKAGELSGIVSVGDKLLILLCTGHTDPVVADFRAVKDELYRDIYEKKLRIKMGERFETISTSAQVDNFLEGISQAAKRPAPAISTRPTGPAPR